MLQKQIQKVSGNLIIWASIITTIAITPKSTSDPINPIKVASLGIFSFAIAALILSKFSSEIFIKNKFPIIAGIIFEVVLVFNLLFSGENFTQEFFGTYGRNTGFVAYTSLTLLLISALILSTHKLVERYLLALILVGILSMIYGYFQFLGLDPAGWTSPYSPVIGFLGNPNFASAFLAISLIASLRLFYEHKQKKISKGFVVGYFLLALFLMTLSGDQQGFLVILIGLSVVLMMRAFFSRFRILSILIFFLSILASVVLFLAILNQGPLAKYIYESSLVSRGHYWRAALSMIHDNPIWGVGLDSFGDWYFRYRSIAAYDWLPSQNTNSAHNVYLDIASSGGLPLILTFFVLNAFVIRSIYIHLKIATSFDPKFAVLVGSWIGFHAQMFISINQIGIAIWGWTISGLIIGYKAQPLNLNSQERENGKIKAKGMSESSQIEPRSILSGFLGIILGGIVGLPPLIADSKYFTEMSSGEPIRIQKAAYIWPPRQNYYLQVAISLRDNKSNTMSANPEVDPDSIVDYSNLGIEVAREMVKIFPNSYFSWELLRSFQAITPEEDKLTKLKMRELNPIAYSATN